jgi:hypothetical protein
MNQLLDRERRPGPRFTEKQGQYLAFIWAYAQIKRRPPAEADMQRYFEVTAPSVHQMVVALERLGLIHRQPGVARSIELLIPPEALPILRAPRPIKSSVQRYWSAIKTGQLRKLRHLARALLPALSGET